MRRSAPLLLLLALLTAGCGGTADPRGEPAAEPAASSGGTVAPATTRTPSPSPSTDTAKPPAQRRTQQPTLVRGIDASHHQGAIDWQRVADAGYAFAYLKATEGRSFVDPRFAAHRSAALAAGVEVAGYHYFSLCSPGAPQAEHLVATLGDIGGPGHLPPAVDLELAGSCATPPPRAALLAEVRGFLRVVEQRTGRRPVVYLYPEFEAEYRFAAALAGYRQWVRALGTTPPDRPWWLWQRSDSGSVPGISGPVDINVMRRR